jgi:hypothetical protein
MRKLSNLIGIFIILLLVIVSLLGITNNFPTQSYVSVANKWFEGGQVPVPLDYKYDDLRKIDIDLISPKETSEAGDFFWLQTSGDLITLTNRNFLDVKGVLSFDLDLDPCRISREVLIGTQKETLLVKTQEDPSSVEFEFNIESNSSIFLSINSSPNTLCQINEGLDRKFMARLSNIKVSNLSAG